MSKRNSLRCMFIFVLIVLSLGVFAKKNVILMIGDGMGMNTIKMAQDYYGEKFIFNDFPVKYFVSTYQEDGSYDPNKAWKDAYASNPVPDWEYLSAATDSAASATAFNSGKKTFNGALNMNALGDKYTTVAMAAKKAGYRVGDITSVTWNHATPAAVFAHNNSRGDSYGISREMIESGIADVIGGAGHPWFDGNGVKKDTPTYGMVEEELWINLEKGKTDYKLISTKAEIEKIAKSKKSKGKYIITYEADGVLPLPDENNKKTVPTLSLISKAMLNVLNSNSDKGFFAMIEGGAIDYANHANDAATSVRQMKEFAEAIKTVVNWVEDNSNWDDTLLIITADHETGQLGNSEDSFWVIDNGKGNLPKYKYNSGGHSNMLVPLFAKGGNSELFSVFATKTDPVYGKYINNINIPAIEASFLGVDLAK